MNIKSILYFGTHCYTSSLRSYLVRRLLVPVCNLGVNSYPGIFLDLM